MNSGAVENKRVLHKKKSYKFSFNKYANYLQRQLQYLNKTHIKNVYAVHLDV